MIRVPPLAPTSCPTPTRGCWRCASAGSTTVYVVAPHGRHLPGRVRVEAVGAPQPSLAFAEWIAGHRYPGSRITARTGKRIDGQGMGEVLFERRTGSDL
jgi:hypothetical protein